MLRSLLAAALFVVPPAIALAQADEDHLAEVDGLRVLHAWTNAGSGDAAEIYMEIENTGDEPATLAEIDAPTAEMGTIVASSVRAEGGVPETLDGLILAPGEATVLEPRGLHLLLSGLEAPREEGEALDLTLTFEPQGEVEVEVEVQAADATQHPHAGHSH